MVEFPKNFPPIKSPSIISFNYSDIIEGTGVIIFNGFTHKEDITLGYALTTQSLHSETLVTTGSTAGATFTKILDLDFDAKFNIAQKIKGKLRVIATIGGESGGANTEASVYLIVQVRRFDGTTETNIVNAQSSTFENFVTTKTYNTVNFEVDITTLQTFARDETLRLTCELWGKNTGGNDRTVGLQHNPKDTEIPTDGKTSILSFYVPFVIEP